MSAHQLTEHWEHSPLNGVALLVMLALADIADDDGWTGPVNYSALAHKARIHLEQLKLTLQGLVGDGYLEIRENVIGHGCDCYRLLPASRR